MARSKTVTVAPARKPKKQYKLLFMVLPFMGDYEKISVN